MLTVVIVIHLMLVLGLIGVVLLQKSEGGGLVSSTSGFMDRPRHGQVLTRTTALLAVGFFITSLALSWLAGLGRHPASIINPGAAPVSEERPGRRLHRSAGPARAFSTSSVAAPRRPLPLRRRANPKSRTRNRQRTMPRMMPLHRQTKPHTSAWHEDFGPAHCRCWHFRAAAACPG